jgi:hypothetical protein
MASGLILAQIAALKDLADASASADASAKTSLCADAPAPYAEPRAAYGAPPYGVVAPAPYGAPRAAYGAPAPYGAPPAPYGAPAPYGVAAPAPYGGSGYGYGRGYWDIVIVNPVTGRWCRTEPTGYRWCWTP